jgi:hypothetical protein
MPRHAVSINSLEAVATMEALRYYHEYVGMMQYFAYGEKPGLAFGAVRRISDPEPERRTLLAWLQV